MQERKEIIEESLSKYCHILVADNIDEAIEFTNAYAPEHLVIVTKDYYKTELDDDLLDKYIERNTYNGKIRLLRRYYGITARKR